jgi:hypothetical protein
MPSEVAADSADSQTGDWSPSDIMNSMKCEVDQARALAYLVGHLKGSLLFSYLPPGVFQRECLHIELVSSTDAPDDCDFRHGYGASGQAAEDWLVAAIIEHLRSDSENIAIVEDASGKSTDPGLTDGAPGQPWFFHDRVLWPIKQDMPDSGLVREAWLWSLSGQRQVVAFARHPHSSCAPDDAVVSDEFLREIGGSITQLAVDAYDGEAFLVWHRRR